MRVAQGLYERGYITYMRTDNVTLSDEALSARARRGRSAATASSSCRRRREQFSSKVKNAQEAHEAIRPIDAVALTRLARRRAERPGAGAVPDDLAAHAGVADGRRHRHHRHACGSAATAVDPTDDDA